MRTLIPVGLAIFTLFAAQPVLLGQDALDELERLIEEPAPEAPEAVVPEAAPAARVPAYLGVSIEHRREARGALLLSVRPDGPAARAGLQPDDVVVAINGKETLMLADFSAAIGALSAGDEARVEVMRGGRRFEFKVTMGAREGGIAIADRNSPRVSDYPPPSSPEPLRMVTGRPILGLQIGPLHTRTYSLLGLSTEWGVLVEDVIPDSPAHRHGVPRGAILIGINGLRVDHVHDVMAMMNRLPPDRPVELTYVLGGRSYRNVIPLEPIARADAAEAAPLDLPPAPAVEPVAPIAPPIPESEPTPPAPEAPTPAAPEVELRLPTTASKVPAGDARVKAMQEELKLLRERAAALEAALDDLRDEAKD